LLLADCIEHIPGAGYVGKINLGLNFFRFSAAGARGLACGLRIAGGTEILSDLIRFVVFERTGMSFLLSDSDFGKGIKNRPAFDF